MLSWATHRDLWTLVAPWLGTRDLFRLVRVSHHSRSAALRELQRENREFIASGKLIHLGTIACSEWMYSERELARFVSKHAEWNKRRDERVIWFDPVEPAESPPVFWAALFENIRRIYAGDELAVRGLWLAASATSKIDAKTLIVFRYTENPNKRGHFAGVTVRICQLHAQRFYSVHEFDANEFLPRGVPRKRALQSDRFLLWGAHVCSLTTSCTGAAELCGACELYSYCRACARRFPETRCDLCGELSPCCDPRLCDSCQKKKVCWRCACDCSAKRQRLIQQ